MYHMCSMLSKAWRVGIAACIAYESVVVTVMRLALCRYPRANKKSKYVTADDTEASYSSEFSRLQKRL